MRRSALVAALLALALPGFVQAQEGMSGMEENAAQTADALSLQALAILEEGRGHEQAIEKLDAALKSDKTGAVDLRTIRDAHTALHHEDVAAAKRLLQHAFPGNRRHVVGITFRPPIGTSELVAGIVGGVILALAAFGLVRRRRAERGLAAAGEQADPT